MTKYFCDRCGREITDVAYTISISTKSLRYNIYEGINEITDTATATVAIHKLELPIYCQACKEKFEKFLKGE